MHLGWDGREQVYLPFNKVLPLVDPNDLVIDGWDISNANLYEAAQRARVKELDKMPLSNVFRCLSQS